jgi:hypothetical protein
VFSCNLVHPQNYVDGQVITYLKEAHGGIRTDNIFLIHFLFRII